MQMQQQQQQQQQAAPPPLGALGAALDGMSGGAFKPRPATTVLKMRGLPYDVDQGDIVDFFKGNEGAGPVDVAPESVLMTLTQDGRPSGQAFVEFTSPEEAQAALKKNKASMGSRYVELFPSSREEATRNAAM
jgi:heterogeneous nuclear ribonucleoprotein F/H